MEANTIPEFKILNPEQYHLWDQFVADAEHGHMHQCAWWGRPLEQYNIKLDLVTAWQDDVLIGGMLLRSIPVPYTKLHITESLDGPIFKDWQSTWTPAFYASCSLVAKQRNSINLKLQSCRNSELHRDLLSLLRNNKQKFQVSAGSTTAPLHLTDKSITDIWQNFRKRAKYNVKQGTKHNITVRQLSDADSLHAAYKTCQATAARKRFSDLRPWAATQQMLEHCIKTNVGAVYGSFYDNKLLASAYVVHVGAEAYYCYGGYLNGSEQYFPNHILQYEIIKDCLERGLQIYNFGNLIEPDNPMNGVDGFKRSFGIEPRENNSTINIINKPLLYNIMYRTRESWLGAKLEGLVRDKLLR